MSIPKFILQMSLILNELVIELSEGFAVFNIRYPMTHEAARHYRIVSDISRNPSWSLRRNLCSERKREKIPARYRFAV